MWTAFITGGASGLGEACVRRVVADGGRAVIADLNESRGEALARELGESARYVRVDVADESQVRAGLEIVDGVNAVVHCAGIVHGEKILGRSGTHDLANFARVVTVNLVGTFNVLRLAAARMETNAPGDDGQRGVVVLTSSVAAFEGQIGQAAYSASKGGVASLVLPAARELAGKGIRVVAIAPGIFETPLMASLPESVRESLAAQSPFPRRLGKPEEFASLAMEVIRNPMLNGCVLRLDAAIRMAAR